jgi:hypothetical protein
VNQTSSTAVGAFSAAASIMPFSGRVRRLTVAEPDHRWRPAAVGRLEELVRLEPGWDGYQGQPVSLLNANFALRMLESICASQSIEPQIVPGSAGDLQIEWHTPSGDIELHVRAPNDVVAWRSGADEVYLTNNFIDVASWIEDLERTGAPAAAA